MTTGVTLTWPEMRLAAAVGIERAIQGMEKKFSPRYGCGLEENWRLNIEGAAGEMALAKFLSRFWSGNLGDLKADDVGQLQVRTSRRPNADLRLHPDDNDDKAFILLTGVAPSFIVRGWLWAREGKLDKYWRDGAQGRPAFWVPQSDLRPPIKNLSS